MASRRCHDETGDECLMPQVGSPPGFANNHGIGYYSVNDYKELLNYAKDRHIQVSVNI
jgi:hexosaminidase